MECRYRVTEAMIGIGLPWRRWSATSLPPVKQTSLSTGKMGSLKRVTSLAERHVLRLLRLFDSGSALILACSSPIVTALK